MSDPERDWSRLRARLWRATREELYSIDPRLLLATSASRILPHLSLNRTRTAVLRALGLRIGKRSLVMGPLRITGNDWQRLLDIGSDTLITAPLHIDVGAPVHIGDRVHIGQNVALLTVDHELGSPMERCGALDPRPIHVGDGAWLGSLSVLLPGVTVGAGSVVAAGAIVTRDVERNTLVAGIPAKLVRRLEP